MDGRLLAILDETLGSRPNLEIVEGDAMRVDLAGLFSPAETVKVVSNLPYNVATPLILRLLRELPQADQHGGHGTARTGGALHGAARAAPLMAACP